MKDWKDLVEQWKALSASGQSERAEALYYERMFPEVIRRFAEAYGSSRSSESLVSVLGYSPEPIILTAKALQPVNHSILTSSPPPSMDRIRAELGAAPRVYEFKDEDFKTIYALLRQMLVDFPTRNITIDITGGKKSTVAIASIFARDYGCRLVYVDFEKYLKDLRKPEPGSERLTVVYEGVT